MIKIEIYTLPVGDAGPERDQIASSLAAIGFFRPEDLTTAPRPTLGSDEETLAKVAADKFVADEKTKRPGRPKKDALKAEAPADPAPAEAAQDAADEAAEVAEEKAAKPAKAEPVYDVNDMRGFGKAYADAYGMDATLSDIPGIIGFAAFSQVPADKVDAVARLVKTAVETNPNNRAKVA